MIDQGIQNRQSPAFIEEEILIEERSSMPGLELVSFLTEVARQKRLVTLVTGVAMLLGAAYSLIMPNLYIATTSIMPPQQAQSSAAMMSQLANAGASSLAAAAAGGGLGVRDPNAIYIGLLRSRPVAYAIIDRFNLTQVYGSRDRTAARGELDKNTQITSERSSMISIAVTDEDKNRAAEIANAYTDQLRILARTISVTEASKRRLFFEQQMKQAKEDLSNAETALQQVQQAHGLVHPEVQANAIITSMARVHGAIESKRVELEALRSFSTDRNPKVQMVERQLSALEREAAQMEHNGATSNFSEMGLKDVSQADLDYARAQKEFTYRQLFFDLLLRQYDTARLDEAKDSAVIQVVEPAIAPERKSAPHRASQTLLFTFLGFLAACFYIFLAGFVKKNEEIAHSLSVLKSAVTSR